MEGDMANITVPVYYWDWIYQQRAMYETLSLLGATVYVGDSADNELTVTATGIAPAPESGYWVPKTVSLQARQDPADVEGDHGWSDIFGLQMITSQSYNDIGISLTFRVKRLDSSDGWGQRLQVDILMGVMAV